MPGAPGGPGSFGPWPGMAGGAVGTGAWVGAFLSAVAFGRFSMVIGHPPSYRSADPAVFADPPEVDGHEDGGDEREGDDVVDVEPDQGIRTDVDAGEDDEGDSVETIGA